MTDEELIETLRKGPEYVYRYVDTDRIEADAKTIADLTAKLEAAERERDELLNQLDSKKHTITVWENRAATLKASAEAAEVALKEAEAKVQMFRDTNRRMNRRVQMLEGWWQRKVARADNWRGTIMDMWRRDRKAITPNMKAIEEAAYQRGFEDGMDARFSIPKRKAHPRKIDTAKHGSQT